MKAKRIIYLVIGCICLGLGTLGVVLPILPTVHFLYGNTVLLFPGFRTAAQLVYWNQSL